MFSLVGFEGAKGEPAAGQKECPFFTKRTTTPCWCGPPPSPKKADLYKTLAKCASGSMQTWFCRSPRACHKTKRTMAKGHLLQGLAWDLLYALTSQKENCVTIDLVTKGLPPDIQAKKTMAQVTYKGLQLG